MLNRNGLFGARDEKLDEKGKTLGTGAYNAGTSGTRSASAEPATPPASLARPAARGFRNVPKADHWGGGSGGEIYPGTAWPAERHESNAAIFAGEF